MKYIFKEDFAEFRKGDVIEGGHGENYTLDRIVSNVYRIHDWIIQTWIKLNWLDEVKEDEGKWKAKPGDMYWYADSDSTIEETQHYNCIVDNGRCEIGNCFRTREEAQVMADKFKALLKEAKK